MASEIVELKLEDFDIATEQSPVTGIDPDVINKACAELEEHANSLTTFITNLIDEKERIVHGWDGQAVETLNAMFPELIEAFSKVPKCVQSIADWAMSYKSVMEAVDDLAVENLKILGGKN